MSHGAAANKSGNTGNASVAVVLQQSGVKFQSEYPTGVTGDFGEEIRVDFYIAHAVGFDSGMFIEVRMQHVSGSAEKKLVALVQNIKRHYGKPTVLIIDGAKADKQRQYAKAEIGGNLRAVFSLGEFSTFARTLSTGGARAFIRQSFDPDQQTLFGRH